MLRVSTFLNILIGAAAAAMAILVIVVKSQIAVDQRNNRALTSKINEEYERASALEAEWAARQRRDMILELAVGIYGENITDVAEEVHVRDLPNRLQEGTGHAQALIMFEAAVQELTLSQAEPEIAQVYDPQAHSIVDPDPIAALIQTAGNLQ